MKRHRIVLDLTREVSLAIRLSAMRQGMTQAQLISEIVTKALRRDLAAAREMLIGARK